MTGGLQVDEDRARAAFVDGIVKRKGYAGDRISKLLGSGEAGRVTRRVAAGGGRVGMPCLDAPEPAGFIGEAGLASTTGEIPGWLALTKAQEHFEETEQQYFSGSCHLDELRLAYQQLQTAERRVTEARP